MRLFVTVGTQFPFDRLVRTVDEWAGRNVDAHVFGQVGPTQYRPRHMLWAPFIDARECRQHVVSADAIIAHAGMGSIITALELGKPIVVMPRQAQFGEHRNEHQSATARSLLALGKVIVAFDEVHLLEKLNHLEQFTCSRPIPTRASPRLLATLQRFVGVGVASNDYSDAEQADPAAEFAIGNQARHPAELNERIAV